MTVSPVHDLRPQIRGQAQRRWEFPYRTMGKRLADILLCLLLLPIVLPVIAVMYYLIRAEGGSAFFGHMRIGRSGRPFRCWKMRTMVPHAQERLELLLQSDPQARAEWDASHKLRDDPRITRLGHFLRQSSLDELPQLWNVLRGEMSLVGPRPVPKAELLKYGIGRRAYLAVRPGITGLWQVSGRNDVSYDERVAMDVAYQQNLSLRLDLKILVRTMGVVLARTGS